MLSLRWLSRQGGGLLHILLATILARSGILTHVRDLAENLLAQGIEVSLSIVRGPSTPSEWHASLLRPLAHLPHMVHGADSHTRLVRFARRRGVDLIHAHSRVNFRACLVATRRLSLPLVVTLHSVFPWMKLYPRTMALAERIIAVGPAQAQTVWSYAGKVQIIQNGINLNRFRPDEGNPLSGPLRVVWFGRTHGLLATGIAVLDEAVGLLLESGRLVDARMIGIAPETNLRHLRVERWVPDPVPHLQFSHIAFARSRAIREAMACGNVGFLLGYGYGGPLNRHWFVDDRYTLAALPEDELPCPTPDSIAADIARFDDDRLALRQARLEARSLALRYFDAQVMARRTLQEVYTSVLGPG